ncbi:DUF4357 domain-containing protein [Microbacterium faecale]|uniref:DUF4357 domain-containing protein n=1 Tax=Microbacterium faecale TaxID=1804630 RepID=UPI00166C647A
MRALRRGLSPCCSSETTALQREHHASTSSHDSHRAHRHQLHASLLADGSLQAIEGGRARFTQDVVFTSSSAAAAVVAGRSANGRTSWIDEASGINFGEWQARGIAD